MPRFSCFLAMGFAAALGALGACADGERPGDAPADSADGPTASADTQRTAVDPSLPVLDGVAPFGPLDEGAAHASFADFRARLLGAVERRDTAALLAAVAADIRNTFGDDNGIAAFRRIWRLDRADTELWRVLGRVLRHGGAFRSAEDDTLFMAPYVYAAWPGEHDAFEHVATLTDDAVARVAPDSASAALGVLPYRIVRYHWQRSDSNAGPEWTEIDPGGGRRAWIASEDVYSPVDYRAIFARREGDWRMITLIAGD